MERLLNTIACPAIALLLLLCFVSTAGARIITVDDDAPADFNNIQAAIDDANNGDTVEIQPGRYTGPGNRDIDFKGKAITVRSTDPNDPNIVAATIIDCEGKQSVPHRGFKFVSNEDLYSVLAGLTITHGYALLEEYEGTFDPIRSTAGGAVFCNNSSPTITRCNIIGNCAASFKVSNGSLVTVYAGVGGGIFNCGGNPTITDCNIAGNTAQASWSSAGHGGGICSIRGNPTITDCNIASNRTQAGPLESPWGASLGGGILCNAINRAVISGCTISENSAETGGGIYCFNCRIDGCTITQNAAGEGLFASGGGIACRRDTTISNCLISGNTASGGRTEDGVSGYSAGGGGIYYYVDSSETDYLTISHCVVTGNRAIGGNGTSGYGGAARGGAIYCVSYSAASGHSVVIRNSTISGNLAKEGSAPIGGKPGKAYGGAVCCKPADLLAHNSILWANSAQFGPEIAALAYDDKTSHITVSYSDLEGSDANTYAEQACTVDLDAGSIASDPCFVRPGYYDVSYPGPGSKIEVWVDGDYHLKSEYGRWNPDSCEWVHDTSTSPCIDAGDLRTTVDLEPLPNGGIVNLGAYGGTSQASMSPNNVGNIADLDRDGLVFRTDIPYFVAQWLISRPLLPADFVSDNIVNFLDFAYFAQNYQPPPPLAPAGNPNPPDGATIAESSPRLSWTSDPNTLWHDIYFGTESPGLFQGRQTTSQFYPGPLDCAATYYWRIDQVNWGGTTTGSVWTFRTAFLPGTAADPNPPDGSVGIRTDPVLSWVAGIGTASHDVHFGIANPPPFQTNQASTTFYPGTLTKETTYCWRIDEVNANGKTAHPVWSFTTGSGGVR